MAIPKTNGVQVEKCLLTATELGSLLGVSAPGIFALVGRLLPPPRCFGRKSRWLVSDVQRCLEQLPAKVRRQRKGAGKGESK